MQSASQLLQCGRVQAAAEAFAAVLLADPENHEALFKMGMACNLQGKLDDACTYYEKVLALTPNMAEANNNLGDIYYRQGHLDKALLRFERARAERPGSAEANNNIGNVLKDQGKLEEALASYAKAMKSQPGNAVVMNNMGDILRQLHRFAEATSQLRKAIALKPDLKEAHYNLSLVLFMLGDLAAGLPAYESRLDVDRKSQYAASGVWATLSQLAAVPRWQGEPLRGRSLLIWTEQGIGDSLMMLRYLPKLVDRGAGKIVVYCAPALSGIFRGKADLILDNRSPLPVGCFDLHCPIMSLPYVFKTTLDSIPNAVPYLAAAESFSSRWNKRLHDYPALKVGLAWAGNRALKSDRLRSFALERYAPLMTVPGVHFFSLQKGDAAQELQAKGWPIHDWMHDCGDLTETAALIDQLDLIISVDTAVAHLAGALGKPIWLLNRFESEWRWMLEREDSPWYPSMRIFRQPVVHDWDSVIGRVRNELAMLASTYRPACAAPTRTKGLLAKLFR
jgi:tetratricopeptide (TPR) repeat protein